MSALTNRRGRESTGLREKPVAGYPLPTKGSNLPNLPRGEGWGIHTYLVHTYRPKRVFCKSRQARLQKCEVTKEPLRRPGWYRAERERNDWKGENKKENVI